MSRTSMASESAFWSCVLAHHFHLIPSMTIDYNLRDLRLCPSSLRHGQCPSKMRWRISPPMGLRTFLTSFQKSMEVTHVKIYQVDEVRASEGEKKKQAPDILTKAGLQTSATKGECGLHVQWITVRSAHLGRECPKSLLMRKCWKVVQEFLPGGS